MALVRPRRLSLYIGRISTTRQGCARRCCFDQAYRTIATPTSLPNRGALDTIHVFPDCPSCASVSEAAPGHPGYNGGRWKVVQAFGITSQLTNADAVVAAASSLVDTGTRFVCPLIQA